MQKISEYLTAAKDAILNKDKLDKCIGAGAPKET
jgi:hypothetical protein